MVIKMSRYANLGKGDSYQCECLSIHFWKAYLDLQKEKRIQKWAGIMAQSGERSGTVPKDYHWIKRDGCKVSINPA